MRNTLNGRVLGGVLFLVADPAYGDPQEIPTLTLCWNLAKLLASLRGRRERFLVVEHFLLM